MDKQYLKSYMQLVIKVHYIAINALNLVVITVRPLIEKPIPYALYAHVRIFLLTCGTRSTGYAVQ